MVAVEQQTETRHDLRSVVRTGQAMMAAVSEATKAKVRIRRRGGAWQVRELSTQILERKQ